MKMFALQSDMNPDMGMVITVGDSVYDDAVELAIAGFSSWFSLEIDNRLRKLYGESADGIVYNSGYFEPVEDLLRDAEINFAIEEGFDDNGDWLEKFKNCKIEMVY